MKKKRRSAYLLESLEARLLFSADMALLPMDGGNSGAENESGLEFSLQPDSGGVQEGDSDTQEGREVIFVDEAVDDFDRLIADLESQRENGRQLDIVALDSNHDGIAQINDYLSQQQDVGAVHIISHGADGEVILGNSRLNSTTLDGYAETIEGWQQALSGDADLLFYGCNLAAGHDGQDLINTLTLLTGADVAASDDVTGNAKFGGDWVLEYGKGEIETAVAISPETQQNWNGVLAVFTVDTTADTVDASPGDGNAKDTFNNTSLRAAIMEANALAGADSITLPAGTYSLSIAGTGDDVNLTGDLDITSDLAITGIGAGITIIDGDGIDRVFHIDFTGNATITNLTIQNGGNVTHGGGIRVSGGGSGGQLNLDHVIVRNNTASVTGGGIFVDGVVTLTDVEISGNTTSGSGGGLSNDEQATLTGVTISGNSATDGAGIFNSNQGSLLSLNNVTISGNTATANGGGIHTARVVTLTNVTVASNLGGGGIYVTGGLGDVELKNSILADNTGGNSNNPLTSLGYNIEDGNSAFTSILGDQPNTDPSLGPLQNNGGFTQTHALLAGSPAIDPVGLSGAPPLDQRGENRDGLPDIGAFESRNNMLVVDTTSDADDGDTSSITTLIGDKGADGRISLREAIIATNNTTNLDGSDWIIFNISGAGTHTIAPTSALPTITDAVTIDATTDDSFAVNGNKPAIVLEGNDFGFGWNGFVLTSTADGSTIRGLVIRNWDADGILIMAGSDNNVIVGNYIGRLNPNGTASGAGTANNGDGVHVEGANNIIGGAVPGAGNVISGNSGDGIRITGAGGNVIQGNYLGTNAAGTADLGNGLDGIRIDDSANNVIGGTTTQTRNIISGNNIHGVRIIGSASTSNTVQGNYIGVNASGSGPLGNTYNGIWVATGASNNLIGGTAPGAGNVISGNSDTGIEIQDSNSTGNRIEGNIIGLNAAGTAAIGNLDGVIIEDAPGNTIGGATNAHRNVISGNTGGVQGNGVVIFGDDATSNLVQNNSIGTDITGTLDLGNAGSGVLISNIGDGGVAKGGASGNTIRDNVLSGNNYSGVSIANPGADNNFIFGNFIGADASGLGALGNSVFGVVIWNGASGNQIGGTAAGEGNVIAFNNRGVIVDANSAASMNNAIRGNSIHSNASLGIDLRNDGVTVNDPGDGIAGPNGLRNYPIITSAVVSGADLTITGTLDTLPSLTAQIDFYWSPTGDPSGHGEGQTFIGTTGVTSDTFGDASFNVTFYGVSVPVGAAVTATATDLSGNTSEFAQNDTTIQGNEAPVVIAPGSALNATEQIGLAIQGMGFSVSDVDEAGAGALATLAVGEGTISVDVGNSGVTIDSGDGTDAVTLSGSIAQLNALLTGTSTGTITYLNNSDTPASSTTLTVTVNDQGNTGIDPGLTGDGSSEEGSNTVTINIASVNDAPTLTTTADNPTFTEGGAAAGLFSATSVSTIESGQTITGLTLTVTNVNDAGNEKLNLDGSILALTDGNSGTTATNSLSYSISVSGTTATVTLSGGTLTTAATQTIVDTISYQNDSADPDTANRVVTLTELVDSGGITNGGDDTATLSIASTIMVLADNDTSSLWLSTNESATDNNAAVINEQDVVSFKNPDLGLELGNGASGTTDGTFATEHTLDENVRALHYVNTAVTVDTFIGGSTGTYELQPGQIVVSMRAADTNDFAVPTVGAGTITVNNTDVLVYTPGTGEYEFLLEDAIFKSDGTTPANIHAISVVEQHTIIGEDTALSAGTYLIARSDPAVHADISTYDNTNGRQDLLLGVDFLSDAGRQIQGLELLEADLVVGGVTLTEGTLLITVQSTGSQTVGTGGGTTVAVEQIDVIALTINETEQDSVTPNTDVDAQIFFDGSDVSLNVASGKEVNGLTLVGNSLDSVNDEPTLTTTADNPTFTEGGAATGLFSATSVGTVESGQTITGLTLTVTNVSDGANEILNIDGSPIALTNGNSGATASLSYNVSVTGTTATVSLSGGTLSEAATQTLVDGLSYQNNSDNPNTSNRVVTLIQLVDSGGIANGGDDTATLSAASTVTIQAVNDEPTLTTTGSDPTFTEGGAATGLFSATSVGTVESGQTITGLTLTVTNVSDGANEILNIDGSPIVLTNGNSGATASLSYNVSVTGTTATVTLSGSTLTTAATQTIVDTISYQNDSADPDTANRVVTLTELVDSGGIANGGDDTATLSVASTVTVVAVNDAPTITSVANTAATEDAAYSYTFTANDVDVGDTLTLSAPTLPAWLSFDPATGILSGTPTNAEVGDHAVVLRVNDGTVDVDQSFTITVANTNDPGTVTIDTTTPAQGDTLTANVIDPDGASGVISYQWFSDGVAIGGATGKTYTTTQTDVGAVMTVTAIYNDDQGTTESLTSAGTAAVTNVNENPIAVNDGLTVNEDHSMTFNSVTDLLGNDSDIDGDTLTISGFTQPANGILADNGDGTFTYTPAGNFNGTDNFTYTISDGNGETATGMAIIVITPVGDTPQVTNVSTNAETQSGLIFINRNASDGTEVTHFKLSGIANGALYLADGLTRIDNGDFITVSQGQAGLRFTPAAGSTAEGSFNVESSEDGVSVSSQSGIATSIISLLTPAPQPSASEHSSPVTEPEQVIDEEIVEEDEALEDVADDTDVQADAGNMFTVETPQKFKAPGTTNPSFNPGISFLNRADLDSDDDKTPDSSMRLSPQTLKMLIEADNIAEMKTVLKKLDITTLPSNTYELFRNSLDAVKEEIGREIMLDKAVLGSAIATSVGLSAGYVVWMLKGGSLLASVLSSLPAWQLADPLAILVGKKEDEDDEDDESLATIIEEGAGHDKGKKSRASELDNIRKETEKR